MLAQLEGVIAPLVAHVLQQKVVGENFVPTLQHRYRISVSLAAAMVSGRALRGCVRYLGRAYSQHKERHADYVANV